MQENHNPELKFGTIVLGVLLVGIVLFGVTLWALLNAQMSPWAIRIGAGCLFVGSVIASWCRGRP